MKKVTRKYPPDFGQLLKVLRREKADRPVLFEYFTNNGLNALLAGRPGFEPATRDELFRMTIDGFYHAGYDHVTIPARFYKSLKFETAAHEKKASVSQNAGAVIVNDDWGFKTQTIFDPDHMRELVFPWHRSIVAAVHARGKPAILHSCGNIYAMLDEIIDDLGYDAKHSYEDVILPVEEAWRQWGDRIAILGGIDMDFLATRTLEEVATRAAGLLELTGSKGYALGSGNSIPPFIPVENYVAMINVVNNLES